MKFKFFLVPLLFIGTEFYAQDSLRLSINQAINRGVNTSHQLKLAETKVEKAIAQYEMAKDQQLPKAALNFSASKAIIPTDILYIPGLTPRPLHLPGSATNYLGTLSLKEVIYGGHKIKYAKRSAQLLKKVAQLDQKRHKTKVMLSIIEAYVQLYELDQNLKIIDKNIIDLEGKIEETQHFKDEGLATLNDVLRFKLQKSSAEITRVNLLHQRKIANFTLATLLSLPENTIIKEDKISAQPPTLLSLSHLIDKALHQREDLQAFKVKKEISENNLKRIESNKLPTLGAGINVYYLNPTQRFFPKKHSYLVPITLGLSLSWDIASLYTNKPKEEEAAIASHQIDIAASSAQDQVKIAVNQAYQVYLKALKNIELLETSVKQSKENDRVMELKYRNQLATTTERIDAQTLYYQSLINLSVAKATATNAWYHLLATTGDLKTYFNPTKQKLQ